MEERALSTTSPEWCDSRLSKRFWDKIVPGKLYEGLDGVCWQWLASKDADGYGKFSVEGVLVGAHRVAYIALVGEIPKHLETDHLCHHRACVNPSHMELVTHAENNRRRLPSTRCMRGHLLSLAGVTEQGWCKHCLRRNRVERRGSCVAISTAIYWAARAR